MDSESLLKLWAVLGPLLTAVVGALWARHLRVSDREHETAREEARLNREEALKLREHRMLEHATLHSELRNAIAAFMAASHEFVRKTTDSLNNPTPESKLAATQANDKFTQSGQEVILLGNDDLESATIELWNAAIAIPKHYQLADDQYEEKLARYKTARTKFNAAAKAFLSEHANRRA